MVLFLKEHGKSVPVALAGRTPQRWWRRLSSLNPHHLNHLALKFSSCLLVQCFSCWWHSLVTAAWDSDLVLSCETYLSPPWRKHRPSKNTSFLLVSKRIKPFVLKMEIEIHIFSLGIFDISACSPKSKAQTKGFNAFPELSSSISLALPNMF